MFWSEIAGLYGNSIYSLFFFYELKTAVYCMDHSYIGHSGSSDDLIERWLIFASMFVKVFQSCPTLRSHGLLHVCDLMEFSRPEYWRRVAFPSSRGSSQPRDRTQVSSTAAILYELSHKGNPRILKWVACPLSSESSWPRSQSRASCIARRLFTNWALRESGMFMCVISLSGLVI